MKQVSVDIDALELVRRELMVSLRPSFSRIGYASRFGELVAQFLDGLLEIRYSFVWWTWVSETGIRVQMNALGLSSTFSASVCWTSCVRGSATVNKAVCDY